MPRSSISALAAYNAAGASAPHRLLERCGDPRRENDWGGDLPVGRDEAGVNEGADVLSVLAERAGVTMWPLTFTVATPSGGRHLYFTAPAGRPIGNRPLGPLVDVRGGGALPFSGETPLTLRPMASGLAEPKLVYLEFTLPKLPLNETASVIRQFASASQPRTS